jgi:PAS domain S-box-containing protein
MVVGAGVTGPPGHDDVGGPADAAVTADVLAGTELAAAQIDLATMRVTAASRAAAAFLGGEPADLVGRPVTDFVADEPTGGLPLLAIGRLDGMEAPRRLRCVDGRTMPAYVWVHVLGQRRPARYAVVVLAGDAVPLPHQLAPDDGVKVIGTTDAEWRVDRISREVETLLGYRPADLSGAPVLSAVHPNDLPGLLSGLAHVHSTGRDAMVRLRIRRRDGTWAWCRTHLASLGGGAGFAFTLRSMAVPGQASRERVRELELRLARIAQEVRAAQLGPPSSATPEIRHLPEAADLTSREWEVLSALVDGSRVPAIADRLGLRPSTVRNHLSAIFRKFGVLSQAELLEVVRSGARRGTH